MKPLYVIILLFICFSGNGQIFIGAKGGISVPDLKGNSEQSKGYTSRQDIYGGLLISFRLNKSLSLQPEINFSPQGGQRKGMQEIPSDVINGISLPPDLNLFANFKTTAILNYLEIPVLLKLEWAHNLTYYVCFGPHIAFLVEAKTKTSGSSLLYLDEAGTILLTDNGNQLPALSFNNATDIKESIKKVNGGIQGGAGFEYPVGPGSFFLDGRAIIGVLNIQRHPEIDGKNRTGSLAVALGYLIKLK